MQLSTENIVAKLSRTGLFERTTPDTLRSIAELMEYDSFKTGQKLFEMGDNGFCSYLVITGIVVIYKHNLVVARFGEGDIFAEFSMMEAKPYSAEARAEGDVQVAKLHHDDFYRLIEKNNDMAKAVIFDLSRRLKRHL